MKLRDFIQQKNVTGFETVQNLVINVEVSEELYQLDVDTSNVEAGTSVSRHTVFTITDSVVQVAGLEVSLDTEVMYDESN